MSQNDIYITFFDIIYDYDSFDLIRCQKQRRQRRMFQRWQKCQLVVPAWSMSAWRASSGSCLFPPSHGFTRSSRRKWWRCVRRSTAGPKNYWKKSGGNLRGKNLILNDYLKNPVGYIFPKFSFHPRSGFK